MKIEIWSDVLCPWCYIGKRRFETALAQFGHVDEIDVVWRSFQLDPNAPLKYDGTNTERLMQKYGVSREQSEAMQDNVAMLAAQEGLEYHMAGAKVTNSFDAHRLIHLAAAHDLQDEMKERLLKAHFVESMLISDEDTLVELAIEVGLDAEEVRQMLESDDFAEAVRADQYQAAVYGIRGVPFFLFDAKYGVSGAQTTAVFGRAFQKAWEESKAAREVVGSGGES